MMMMMMMMMMMVQDLEPRIKKNLKILIPGFFFSFLLLKIEFTAITQTLHAYVL